MNAHRVNQHSIDENVTLIEWISAIYGIFWGVWLAFFITKLSDAQPQKPLLPLKEYILAGFAILILLYTYFLVKWLWSLRLLSPNETFSFVMSKIRPAVSLVILSFIIIGILGFLFKIPSVWVIMGVLATSSWLILAASMVLVDRRGWK